jgi:hypothetical protein
MKAKGGAVDRVTIPELEEAAKSYHSRWWTKSEEGIIRAYWGRVHPSKLAEHIPGRSADAIRYQARRMGL